MLRKPSSMMSLESHLATVRATGSLGAKASKLPLLDHTSAGSSYELQR